MYIIAEAEAAAPLTVSTGAAQSPFLIISGEPGAGTQNNLNLPGSGKYNGQAFIVRASGFITVPAGTWTSSATPLQFALWGSNTASFTAASGNVLWTAASYAIFSITSATARTTVPWSFEVEMEGDSTSGIIVGNGNARLTVSPSVVTGLTAVTPTVIAQSPTTLNFSAEPPIQFAVGVITAASNLLAASGTGGTVVTLTQFLIES